MGRISGVNMTFYLSDGQTIEVAATGPNRPFSSEQESVLMRGDTRSGEIPESRPDVRRNLRRKNLIGKDDRLTGLAVEVVRALQHKRGARPGSARPKAVRRA